MLLFLVINVIIPSDLSFDDAMVQLASDLYEESLNLVDDKQYV